MLVDAQDPSSWPTEIAELIEAHLELCVHRETGCDGYFDRYQRQLQKLRAMLVPHSLLGWHCTRLTDREVAAIKSTGMQLPNRGMLEARIDAAHADGLVSAQIAEQLKARNQADEASRAGRIWFCFFPPGLAHQHGIERFFRNWGGEALYNSHEDDELTGKALRTMGRPALVEAQVPVSLLAERSWLPDRFVRCYLVSRGYRITEDRKHEEGLRSAIAAEHIRAVHLHPSPEFLSLSGCEVWRTPLW